MEEDPYASEEDDSKDEEVEDDHHESEEDDSDDEEDQGKVGGSWGGAFGSVSYTHLTLPTKA